MIDRMIARAIAMMLYDRSLSLPISTGFFKANTSAKKSNVLPRHVHVQVARSPGNAARAMEEQSFQEFISGLSSDREAKTLSGACQRREAPKFSGARMPGQRRAGKLVIYKHNTSQTAVAVSLYSAQQWRRACILRFCATHYPGGHATLYNHQPQLQQLPNISRNLEGISLCTWTQHESGVE